MVTNTFRIEITHSVALASRFVLPRLLTAHLEPEHLGGLIN